jgi:signal transduction histidine kinase
MRVVYVLFAAIGGCALASATAIELAVGHPANIAWGLLSAPFYVAGLAGVLSGRTGARAAAEGAGASTSADGAGAARASGRDVSAWLLAAGALFLVGTCLGDALDDIPGLTLSSSAWLLVLFADIAANGSVVAGIGLVGLFPAGVPETRAERSVLAAAAAAAVALPVLDMIIFPSPPAGLFESAQPDIVSPLYSPAAGFLASAAIALRYTFAVLVLLGLVLLYLRYRRGSAAARRLTRWLLAGLGAAMVVFAVLTALSLLASGPLVTVTVLVLWGLAVLIVLVSLTAALSGGGLLSTDQATSRTVAYRTLWLLIAVAYVATATGLGILASLNLPDWAGMLLVAAAALAFQPVQRRLERLADRWVFGRRLDGYQVITRFGTLLESSPGPADLLPRLAAAIREGLALRWVRVRLDRDLAGSGGLPGLGGRAGPRDVNGPADLIGSADLIGTADLIGSADLIGRADLIGPADQVGPVAAAGIGLADAADPAHVIPLVQAGLVLGRIECGPRHDGPLLDEDRRLLAHLAAQAATAVSNVRLNAELGDRLAVIERQAAELTASRARLVKSTDDERRRIQRDLHDGPQQDLVVLSANLALARERLRRADPRADGTLAGVQADLGGLLARLREFAHAIHPPVLADQGLLEAIGAQASRLPLEVVVEADPELRGVRYPEQIETAAWYVVAEAMTNAVKHAAAARLCIRLTQQAGLLAVEVSDDGCGFAPGAPRGLGLTGLADRMAIVHGTLCVDSGPGQGTRLRAEIPLPGPAAAEPVSAVSTPAGPATGRAATGPAGTGPATGPAGAGSSAVGPAGAGSSVAGPGDAGSAGPVAVTRAGVQHG